MDAGFVHVQGIDVEADTILAQDGVEAGPKRAFPDEVGPQKAADVEIADGELTAETGGGSLCKQVFRLDHAGDAAGSGGESAVEGQVVGGSGQLAVEDEGLARGVAGDGFAFARRKGVDDTPGGGRREGEVSDLGVDIALVGMGDAFHPAAQVAGDAAFLAEREIVDIQVVDRSAYVGVGDMGFQLRQAGSDEGAERPPVQIGIDDLRVKVHITGEVGE